MATKGRLAVNIGVYFLCSVVVSSALQGEYIVSQSPSSLHYKGGAGNLPASQIPGLITATYGFSLNKDLTWGGLSQGSVFHRPKANVIVSVPAAEASVPKLNIKNIARYGIDMDDVEVNTEEVANQLMSRMEGSPLVVDFSTDNTVFDLRAEHPDLMRSVPGTLTDLRKLFESGDSSLSGLAPSLNVSREADLLFLGELYAIQAILQALEGAPGAAKDSTPDLYHFRLSGLRELTRTHGAGSIQVADATRLLGRQLDKLTSAFQHVYGDGVVVQVAVLPQPDAPQLRKTRSLLQEPKPTPNPLPKEIGVTAAYSDDYAVIFNIVLWLSITLIITLLGIGYGMWFMDPGRDSIIYRMTSQRMKKE